ncbi:MAG: hypothetical protein ABW220_14850 [Burkholderiaceae bacterium]
MIHPIFGAVLRRPDLLFDHLSNYAGLVRGEIAATGSALAVRAAGAAVAVIAVLLALGLTGIAVMLGALQGAFHWVLVLVPAVAWLLAIAGGVAAMRPTLANRVEDVKDELDADFHMLRLVKESRDD